MNIYDLLFYHNPQALQNLHNFQMRWYDTGIEKPIDNSPDITSHVNIELEEIDRLMRQAPSRSRSE